MRRSLIVQDVKKSLLSGHCVFFLVLGLPTATQVHAEEKLSLFILDDLFVGFHCFPPAPLYTGRARRGEEERLPFFARRKIVDPRLSPALPSLPRSTPHVTQGSGFLCVGCCWSILFSCIAFLSCAVCLRFGGEWAFSNVVAREEGQRVGVFARLRAQRRTLGAQFQSNAIWLPMFVSSLLLAADSCFTRFLRGTATGVRRRYEKNARRPCSWRGTSSPV